MCPKLEIKQWIIQERSLLSWSSRTRRAITEGKQVRTFQVKISALKIRQSDG